MVVITPHEKGRFYDEGYEDGFAHGKVHGMIEGRELGREKGFEMWEELANRINKFLEVSFQRSQRIANDASEV